MSRNNTGNPIGSKAFPDFEDNVKNLDEAVNAEQDTFQDRLGKSRLTWAGMESEFDAAQSSRENQFHSTQSYREAVFSDFLQASGYQDLGEYAPGIEITAHNQYVTFGGQPYTLKPSIPVPYTTSGEWTGDDFKLIGDDSLRQDLASPDKGAAMVARGVVAIDSIADLLSLPEEQRKEDLRYLVKGYHAGSDAGGGEFYWDGVSNEAGNSVNIFAPPETPAGRFKRRGGSTVSIEDAGGVGDGVTPCSDALAAAWGAVPAGGTFTTLPLQYRIEKPVSLPYIGINLDVRGEFVVDDGPWVGIQIGAEADVAHQFTGLDFDAIGAGDINLAPLSDLGVGNSQEYFVTLNSDEDLVVRVGAANYTPYKKVETHNVIAHDFLLSDPILYSYAQPELLSVRFIRKARQCTWHGLKVRTDDALSPTNRTLLQLNYVSCVAIHGLSITQVHSSAGNGVLLNRCCDLEIVSPSIDGYLVTGADSYKVLNAGSAYITFRRFNSRTPKDPIGNAEVRDYNARHGNHVVFDDCVLIGVDDHFGSNYEIRNSSIHGSVKYAGRNFKFRNVEKVGPGWLFQLRLDTPQVHGILDMDDIRIDSGSLAYLTTSSSADPLGRTTEFKTFDTIKVGRVHFSGVQTSGSLVTLSGNRQPTTFTSLPSEYIEISDVDVACEIGGAAYSFMDIGDVDVDCIRVRKARFRRQPEDLFGEVRLSAATASCNLGHLIFDECEGVSVYDAKNIEALTFNSSGVYGRGGVLIGVSLNAIKLTINGGVMGNRGRLYALPPGGSGQKTLFISSGVRYENNTLANQFGADSVTLALSQNNVSLAGSRRPPIFGDDKWGYYADPAHFTGDAGLA